MLALKKVYAERLRTSKIVGIHLKVRLYIRHDELCLELNSSCQMKAEMLSLVDAASKIPSGREAWFQHSLEVSGTLPRAFSWPLP